MITAEYAVTFAREWIAAWNAHDLDRILSHYTDDVEMSSPIVAQLTGEASGTLRGKPAVRAYWGTALAAHPELHFDLVEVYFGAHSLTVTYRGHRGLAAEVFWLDAQDKVYRAAAHYLGPASRGTDE
jgi:ketosteroid isomerase-like protein